MKEDFKEMTSILIENYKFNEFEVKQFCSKLEDLGDGITLEAVQNVVKGIILERIKVINKFQKLGKKPEFIEYFSDRVYNKIHDNLNEEQV